jgi:hypothetical protein
MYQWAVVPSAYLTKLQPDEYVPIDVFLSTQVGPTLSVPSAILPGDRSYKLQLTVTNWLQAQHSETYIVQKSAVALHTVSFEGSDNLLIKADEDFLAILDVQQSPCGNPQNPYYNHQNPYYNHQNPY